MVKKKKAAVAVAVTAAAVAGMVTETAFDSPTDLIPEITEELHQTDDGGAAPEERHKGPLTKVRSWVLGLPAAVRILVVVPLWGLGWVLLSAASVFWVGAAPWLARLLAWVSLTVVLMAVFTGTVKAAFPNVSVRRILRPGTVLVFLGFGVLVCAADLALPTVWSGYNAVSSTVWRVGATLLLAFLCGMAWKRHGRREAVSQKKAMPERTEIEREAMRLADTVCEK